MPEEEDWQGLRRIDQALGLPKGSAFREFRRLAANWQEGWDFRVLDHVRDREALQRLKLAGEVYSSSVNGVVLRRTRAHELSAQLASSARSGNENYYIPDSVASKPPAS